MDDGTCLMVMKGAPERILQRCSHMCTTNGTEEMSDEWRMLCDKAMTELAEKGERYVKMLIVY